MTGADDVFILLKTTVVLIQELEHISTGCNPTMSKFEPIQPYIGLKREDRGKRGRTVEEPPISLTTFVVAPTRPLPYT